MITELEDYWKQVMEKGTDEAKTLLEMEALFAATEAGAIIKIFGISEAHKAELQRRLILLLIAHRGPVIASFLMERGRGIPIPKDGPGPVV